MAKGKAGISDIQLEAFAKRIHSGELTTGQVDEAIAALVQQHLWQGVTTGYGKQITDLDWDTPDKIMMAKLEANTFYFSAAKNYWHIATLNEALIGADGKALPWAQFKQKALEINNQVLVHRLQAEYNHAIASSQMARKWVEIQEAKELYPYLRYRTAGDANVRPEHKAWHNMLKPVDDAFWRTHYPPNGWNCRCTVEQVRDGKPSTQPYTSDSIPQIFQINVGQQAVVYPPRHPYYALAGENAETVKAAAARMFKAKSECYRLIAEFANGGKIEAHGLLSMRDAEDNLQKFYEFAKAGHKVKLAPLAEQQGVKNADAIMDDIITEHKALTTIKPRTIKEQIEYACKAQKAAAIVLQLKNFEKYSDVHRALRYCFIYDKEPINKTVDFIMLMNSTGEWMRIERSEIVNNTPKYWMALKKLFK
ncbi:MAG: hypothetical protein RL660_450 [Bacteroidota bacterium]|jgi:SPP1 gp7 family putative phage head morphogenesis protein